MQELGRDLKCLIIDDDPIILELMEGLLKCFGCTNVMLADTGEKGVRAYTSDIDITFVDLMLPERDGFEVLAEIQTLNPNAFFVVISSKDDFESYQKADQLGVKTFLNKPLSPARVAWALNSYKLEKDTDS